MNIWKRDGMKHLGETMEGTPRSSADERVPPASAEPLHRVLKLQHPKRIRRFLLPRFPPPKLTIAVGPAKLVEILGFYRTPRLRIPTVNPLLPHDANCFFNWMDR